MLLFDCWMKNSNQIKSAVELLCYCQKDLLILLGCLIWRLRMDFYLHSLDSVYPPNCTSMRNRMQIVAAVAASAECFVLMSAKRTVEVTLMSMKKRTLVIELYLRSELDSKSMVVVIESYLIEPL